MGDVHALMPRIPKLNNKGVPDLDFFMQYTYEGCAVLVPGYVDEAIRKYGYKGTPIDDDDMHGLIRRMGEYFTWFHKSVDTDGRVQRVDVIAYLKETLNYL